MRKFGQKMGFMGVYARAYRRVVIFSCVLRNNTNYSDERVN